MFTGDVIDPFEIMKLMLFWVKTSWKRAMLKVLKYMGMANIYDQGKSITKKIANLLVLPPQQSTTF
jgi:hypothetical protein